MNKEKTDMWRADREEDMQQAVSALRDGKLVAFPTETVYGLGADGFNAIACADIYRAKGRPADNPLILHIADIEDLSGIARDIPEVAYTLARAFWPGPLTLILHKQAGVPDAVTGGLDTVAVRMPDHPIARELIQGVGRPLAAPSANRSGRPSPTTAAHVAQDLAGEVAGIIDGGPCEVGLESTILDLTVDPPVILRPGGISREALEAVIGPVTAWVETHELQEGPKAPGMKYRHYAPEAPVFLLDEGEKASQLQGLLEGEPVAGRIGLLLSDETIATLGTPPLFVLVYNLGSQLHPETAAQRLFDGLRRLDAEGVQEIYTESWPEEAIGGAIMNRVRKLSKPFCKEEKK